MLHFKPLFVLLILNHHFNWTVIKYEDGFRIQARLLVLYIYICIYIYIYIYIYENSSREKGLRPPIFCQLSWGPRGHCYLFWFLKLVLLDLGLFFFFLIGGGGGGGRGSKLPLSLNFKRPSLAVPKNNAKMCTTLLIINFICTTYRAHIGWCYKCV